MNHLAVEVWGRYTLDDAGRFSTQNPTTGVIVAGSTTFWWEFPAPFSWAQEEIWTAMQAELVPGAQNTISRKQFCWTAMYAWHVLRPDAQPFTTLTFNDTIDKLVLEAASYGFVNGNGKGGFWPDISISRRETATILMRVADGLGMSGGGSGSSCKYIDSDKSSSWARDTVFFDQ